MTLTEVLGNNMDDVNFTGVYIHRKDLVYVRGVLKSLDEEEVNHAIMFRWFAGEWRQYTIPTIISSHCVIDEPDRKVLSLSPDGTVHVANPEGFDWEKLDTREDGPSSLRAILEIRVIAGTVYAVGAGRMVYKRTVPNTWVRWDNGIPENQSVDWLGVFFSIDGFTPNSLYAAGASGEIWHFDGTTWFLLDSPTNISLQKVKCVAPNSVFICGNGGTFLKGNRKTWEVIEHDATDSALWGMEHFEGQIYLADNSAIYVFDGKQVREVDTGLGSPLTAGYLHANDGVLWAVGERDILVYDGSIWNRFF